MSSIGVDTGGTFTDLVYLNELGELKIAKKPSTPHNFSQGVLDVVSALASSETILSNLDHFYHGTTVATNAMITGSGAKIGFSGPRVIESTVKESLPKDFQSARFLLEKGHLDLEIERKYIKATVSTLLSILLKKKENIKISKTDNESNLEETLPKTSKAV